MNEPDKAWLRSLPLLLSAAILMIAGAFAFFRAGDQIASIAAFSTALILLGAWIYSVVIEHDHATHHKRDESKPED